MPTPCQPRLSISIVPSQAFESNGTSNCTTKEHDADPQALDTSQ